MYLVDKVKFQLKIPIILCEVAEYYSLMFDPRNCKKNLCCQVKLEWHSLVFCSLGAIVGMIFGLEVSLQEQRLKFMEIDFALGKKFRLKSGGRHSLDASREEAELCLHLVQLCLRPLPPQQRTQEEDV